MRTLSTLLCLLVVGLNTQLTLAASACSEDFKNKNWTSAIASCLAEGSRQSFRIGYSYSKINNCTESNKWYKKNDTASAYMNMSLSSCVSDTEKLKLIDQSIAKKPNAANYYWKGEFLSEDVPEGQFIDRMVILAWLPCLVTWLQDDDVMGMLLGKTVLQADFHLRMVDIIFCLSLVDITFCAFVVVDII